MEGGILSPVPAATLLVGTSPTKFLSMRRCALREVWAAGGISPLLPSGPAARLGSVIHQLLEEAGKGAFAAGHVAGIEGRWQELINAAERGMHRNWLEQHLTPLRDSIPSYEVRRIQARERALELAEMAASREGATRAAEPEAGSLRFGCELAVATTDGLVRGRIDAALPSERGPLLRDYKSGPVFESRLERQAILNESYEIQLRMYAALYFQTTGVWPARLEVVPVLGPPQEVSFDPEECLQVVNEARELLKAVNEVIAATAGSSSEFQARLASPDPSTCSFCSYRPGCTSYLGSARDSSGWPHDISGILESMTKLGNKKIVLTLRDGGGRMLAVRGLTPALRHPALARISAGDGVSIFNLRPAGSPSSFIESPLTVIYKHGGSPRRTPNGASHTLA